MPGWVDPLSVIVLRVVELLLALVDNLLTCVVMFIDSVVGIVVFDCVVPSEVELVLV